MHIAPSTYGEIVVMRKAAATNTEEAVTPELMTFKAWKDQKVIEAQNLSTRLNNRIVLLKAGKIKPEELAAEFPQFANENESAALTKRAQKLRGNDLTTRLERELARAQKTLEFARDLTLQEYAVGYLNQFQDYPDAIAKMTSKLSKEELADLVKALLDSSSPTLDTRKNDRIKTSPEKGEVSARF